MNFLNNVDLNKAFKPLVYFYFFLSYRSFSLSCVFSRVQPQSEPEKTEFISFTNMNSTELDECYEFVKKLVLDCGEVLKTGFKNPGKVTTKEGAHDLGRFVCLVYLPANNKANIITCSYFL